MRDREDLPQHESHGQIQFNRVSGGWNTRFHGSPIGAGHFIQLTLSEGQTTFDRVSGTHHYDGKVVCRVRMTATQFAEAITSMNMGAGIPVTFELVRAGPLKRCEDPPAEQSEAVRIADAFEGEVGEKLASLKAMRRRIQKLLDEAKIGQARKEAIDRELWSFFRLFEDSAPFMMKRFEEATIASVQDAKANVAAFVEGALRQTGLAALTGGRAPVTLELGAPTPHEELIPETVECACPEEEYPVGSNHAGFCPKGGLVTEEDR